MFGEGAGEPLSVGARAAGGLAPLGDAFHETQRAEPASPSPEEECPRRDSTGGGRNRCVGDGSVDWECGWCARTAVPQVPRWCQPTAHRVPCRIAAWKPVPRPRAGVLHRWDDRSRHRKPGENQSNEGYFANLRDALQELKKIDARNCE